KQEKTVDGISSTIINTEIPDISKNELRILGDNLYEKIRSGICVIGVNSKIKPPIMVVVSQDLVERGVHAGDLANTIGYGNGGGKPHMGFTGANDINEMREMLGQTDTHILHVLKTLK
ncbi:MAG: hypothetical protein V3W20_12430, partial [Candidatus Neomarinimicrobiota bacterium]